jgi:hypothetical protein
LVCCTKCCSAAQWTLHPPQKQKTRVRIPPGYKLFRKNIAVFVCRKREIKTLTLKYKKIGIPDSYPLRETLGMKLFRIRSKYVYVCKPRVNKAALDRCCSLECVHQGDRIRRIFARRAIVHFGLFFENYRSSPICIVLVPRQLVKCPLVK